MINTIIFDLGAVLIDWNPKYLYRKIFDDESQIDHFLNTICTPDWNEEQDAGRSLYNGTEILVAQLPDSADNIRAFYGRWDEMLGDEIAGTVKIFRQIKKLDIYKIYALTNWSAETFPVALKRFDFLNWFDGIVVSGTEKLRKPAPEFYRILLERYDVKADEALFIDDNLRNVTAAREMGIDTIHFQSPEQLQEELLKRNIPV
ncbi:MAG: HAD family phosphatase [Flavobacterium sp.]|nr:HAD family phosphatase [Pedobacter sp.]